MSTLMELGIWDESGYRYEEYMKIRRVLPCLAVVLLDSGAHALVGLDGGDELQEISHVFTATPKLEPVVDEASSDDAQMDRWEAWFDVANEQMELLANSFNLTESFYILSDALDVGFKMDEQFIFWFYNRIAAAVELMEGDPVRGRYEYPLTDEQAEELLTIEEVSGLEEEQDEFAGDSDSRDNIFVEPKDK